MKEGGAPKRSLSSYKLVQTETRAQVLHTPITHCTLHTSHYTQHTAHCTLHTSHYTLHTSHYTLHTTHYALKLRERGEKEGGRRKERER